MQKLAYFQRKGVAVWICALCKAYCKDVW